MRQRGCWSASAPSRTGSSDSARLRSRLRSSGGSRRRIPRRSGRHSEPSPHLHPPSPSRIWRCASRPSRSSSSASVLSESTEALEELRDGREAQRHVRERDGGWRNGEGSECLPERLGILRREPPLDRRRERSRAESEEPVLLGAEALQQPRCRLLHAAVLCEAPRELLRSLLGLELAELGSLLREERTRLQLEESRHEHEE